jgi:putative transposase
MGRPARQFVPGYPVHVIHRGNNRQVVFRCESDFRLLWRCLKEASGHFGVDINAYVFMTNHVHLLATPRTCSSISDMMHWSAQRYSRYFNTRYERTGALWEGRFRASLVTQDSYFLACHRYIDLNPVRAGLARSPSDYAWSSHRFYVYGEANSLVTPHHALLQLGFNDASRRRAYAALFEQPFDDAALDVIRSCVNSGTETGIVIRRGRPRRNRA